MLRRRVSASVQAAIDRLVARGVLPAAGHPAVEVDPPKQAEHGDFATNWAMVAFKAVSAAPSSSDGCADEEAVGGGDPAARPTNPRALGEALAAELAEDPLIASAEVAGPGFVNLRLSGAPLVAVIADVSGSSDKSILSDCSHFARPTSDATSPTPCQRINVEFVSVNPNGPITIGSGRGAAYGSTLANVLEAAGHQVHREYYINDGVNSEQMRQFAESVKAICEDRPIPEKGYRGDYVTAVADNLVSGAREHHDLGWYQKSSQEAMLASQTHDLAAFGVTFDTWFSEQSLHDSGKVQEHLDNLTTNGAADDQPYRTVLKLAKGGVVESATREEQTAAMEEEDASGESPVATPESPVASTGLTLWLRSTKFGDDMDRVLRRKDGRLTYIASDIAYHADKFNRPPNADKLITILGPDHHGYINRLHAVVAAVLREKVGIDRSNSTYETNNRESGALSDWESVVFDSPEERDACRVALAESEKRLEVLIFQLVRFMKDGKPAPMRKRDGNIYALIDLVNEIGAKVKPNGTKEEQQAAGKDVARFFYLMRHHDTTFDFDLDLAEKQSDENPVFYVQYAHARVCSVLAKAKEAGFAAPESGSGRPTGSLHPNERALILKIADLPHEVGRCAEDYGVNRLTTYAVELARTYHHFYDACRVINPEDVVTTGWRLAVCEATRVTLRAAFELLGVSAPERMDRETS